MTDRRRFLKAGGAALASLAAAPLLARTAATGTPAAVSAAGAIAEATDFDALERISGGRLGVALMDAQGKVIAGHRQKELFPMCSTFKWLLGAAALHQSERSPGLLDRRIPMRAVDLIEHAPITSRHVGKDLTVRDLCRATMMTSDNPAANLLLRLLGGPAGITAFLRANGDDVTRNDRYEPEMNRFEPGDPRDTTSPVATAGSLRRIVLGNVLNDASRLQLTDWLIDNATGDARLRAGLGQRWRIGDRTGGDGKSISNDIAVLWPLAGGTPWILTSYLQGATVDGTMRDVVLKQVGVLADRMIA
ncbi:class A beta-lactamase [Stenotrophomonas sp. CFBP 13718]|uniref:class A beta-lactamase n=1 Tax=Stenotrophomonas sp. CFBP 13718 TaxID=2775304 RepID=UPI00177D8C77|nr:class A beta-lactamase [Stenotrophomonas sp. CFBP 13718]MBD8696966.1 class A beta-lactamase [Stenotrophomonas sp. CFBP 13718]